MLRRQVFGGVDGDDLAQLTRRTARAQLLVVASYRPEALADEARIRIGRVGDQQCTHDHYRR